MDEFSKSIVATYKEKDQFHRNLILENIHASKNLAGTPQNTPHGSTKCFSFLYHSNKFEPDFFETYF